MPAAPEPASPPEGDLELAADEAIDACGGDAREAVKALLVTMNFLENEIAELGGAISKGYSRGRHAARRDLKE
ncbi:hypothetical protein [Bradyrhizobium vignae]|uniref:Transposase n=1 Tax=Bradyrhizobium vignae TaxID=1549949 RepID=A0ABS3ZXD2_9BRAD|nr:hypothetical protein [Bradyrhizobium vignae]MBP0112811.1 hypothetical protein [Bradyrhizobium vignae]